MPPARRHPPPLNSLSSTAVPIIAQPGSSRVLMPVCRLSPFYQQPVSSLVTGFATAMNVKPKWLRDLCSVLFSFYYIFYANEADEKVLSILPTFAILMPEQLRRFRATCTVETLRVTWEKTGNPIVSKLSTSL